jgi:hypothetical protein
VVAGVFAAVLLVGGVVLGAAYHFRPGQARVSGADAVAEASAPKAPEPDPVPLPRETVADRPAPVVAAERNLRPVFPVVPPSRPETPPDDTTPPPEPAPRPEPKPEPPPPPKPESTRPVIGRQVGNLAPEIEGIDLFGKKFKLSEYRGKVVVLDFWGNW